jgi:hypothetical protein
MLTTEERWQAGLRALLRFKQKNSPPLELTEAFSVLYRERSGSKAPPGILLPCLQELLTRYGPFPQASMLIGVCEDGLPFLLNLDIPACGSILLAGDPGSGKERLLHSMLASIPYTSSPERVVFHLVTAQAERYRRLTRHAHCASVTQAQSADCGQLIESLLYLADCRMLQDDQGTVIVLAIEDLADFIHSLEDETYWGFDWLVRHGPTRRIWVIACQSSDSLNWVDHDLLSAFPTRFLGSFSSPEVAAYLSGDAHFVLPAMHTGAQFCVPNDEDWLPVWIIHPEES